MSPRAVDEKLGIEGREELAKASTEFAL